MAGWGAAGDRSGGVVRGRRTRVPGALRVRTSSRSVAILHGGDPGTPGDRRARSERPGAGATKEEERRHAPGDAATATRGSDGIRDRERVAPWRRVAGPRT